MNERGFTLFELLIYVGIVGLILLTLGLSLINLLYGRVKVRAISEVLSNARIIEQQLSDAVRHAEGINVATSTFDSDPGVLSFNMVNAQADPTVFSLTSDNGSMQISEAGTANESITTDQILVTNLVFHNLTGAGDIGVVQVEYTLQTNNPSGLKYYDYAESFQTTLRIPLD
ncbi:prepilin-type N-terminal cleavage/methylation domain-containing protein [Candidatus Uhrbacteria bacterium]|nr:prepilin-type N-terminal cleavage/methylation domain-containing protein [Candidatus Uhrbacteria bacterium]